MQLIHERSARNSDRLGKNINHGIRIGMNYIIDAARRRTAPERSAMIWLSNYAQLCDVSACELSEALSMTQTDVRFALTSPDADLAAFVRQVDKLRAKFEREELSALLEVPSLPIAETKISRKVANAVKFAERSPQIIEIVGKTRIGKTVAARHEYLRRLDRAAWLHCPSDTTNRAFFQALARGIGVSARDGWFTNGDVAAKIAACFGERRLKLLFVDEGHRLWPSNLETRPARIEFLRDLWELHRVSVVILATPQYSESLELAMADNPRWAPGQWDGRVQRFPLPDSMDDADLATVARSHAPEFSEAMIAQLVEQAKASEGFCGAMVKAIQRTRFMVADSEPCNVDTLKLAQRQLARAERIEGGASTMTRKRRRQA